MQLNPVVNRICLVQPSLNHLIQSAEFNNLTGFTCARHALVIHFWSSRLFSGPEVACNWKWNYSLKTLNTGKETGVRNIPVILKGYSVTHLDFCGDNMLKYLLFSHSLLTTGNALLICIVCSHRRHKILVEGISNPISIWSQSSVWRCSLLSPGKTFLSFSRKLCDRSHSYQ